MTGCLKCDERAAVVNKEPRRVVMLAVMYETDVEPRELREPDIFRQWQALPDDGMQYVKAWYNHCNPSNGEPYKANIAGGVVYYMVPCFDGGWIIACDNAMTVAEVERRYPGASVKRGKDTSPANIDRINAIMGGL